MHVDMAPPGPDWSMLDGAPFVQHVGPFWIRQSAEGNELAFRADERHLNRAGRVHGGMTAGFIDTCFGYMAGTGGLPVTVQLDVNFLEPIAVGDLVVGRAELIRGGKSLSFGQCRIFVADKLVAVASAVLALRRQPGA